MARINKKALMSIQNKKVAPIVNRQTLNKLKSVVNSAHQEMIQNFENHPITQEIDGGSEAQNSSGTLGGYGNLFSFIGFEEGMDPIEPIRNILRKTLEVRSVPKSHQSIIMNFLIEIPDKEKIFQSSPMPWANGRSWAEGIEKGISGLGQYLNTDTSSSRSGKGIQVKHDVRGGGFRNTKYLSSILNDLKKRIKGGIK